MVNILKGVMMMVIKNIMSIVLNNVGKMLFEVFVCLGELVRKILIFENVICYFFYVFRWLIKFIFWILEMGIINGVLLVKFINKVYLVCVVFNVFICFWYLLNDVIKCFFVGVLVIILCLLNWDSVLWIGVRCCVFKFLIWVFIWVIFFSIILMFLRGWGGLDGMMMYLGIVNICLLFNSFIFVFLFVSREVFIFFWDNWIWKL